MHVSQPGLRIAVVVLGLAAAACSASSEAAAPPVEPPRPLSAPPAPAPSPAARPPALKRLGILVFPGVQVIDFAGPYEVLSSVHFRDRRVFDVVTVGLSADELRTSPGFEGLRLRPEYTLATCPRLDLLVIPGGEIGSVGDDPRAMAWLDRTIGEAECVMSVCNGAFLLAKGGHLKDQRATTFYYFIDELADDEPTCTPVHDERFVDNGKIVTTAGLTSGLDGALHLVERYTDHHTAEQVALGLEYHWQPESGWARGALADRHYITMVGSGFEFPPGSLRDWRTIENTGDLEHWTKRWTFTSALSRAELYALLDPKLAASWRRNPQAGESVWEFEDDAGRPWRAEFTLDGPDEGAWTLTLRIARR